MKTTVAKLSVVFISLIVFNLILIGVSDARIDSKTCVGLSLNIKGENRIGFG